MRARINTSCVYLSTQNGYCLYFDFGSVLQYTLVLLKNVLNILCEGRQLTSIFAEINDVTQRVQKYLVAAKGAVGMPVGEAMLQLREKRFVFAYPFFPPQTNDPIVVRDGKCEPHLFIAARRPTRIRSCSSRSW